jgi:hypothetical protein
MLAVAGCNRYRGQAVVNDVLIASWALQCCMFNIVGCGDDPTPYLVDFISNHQSLSACAALFTNVALSAHTQKTVCSVMEAGSA